MLVPQVAQDGVQAPVVVTQHAVEVADLLVAEVHARQAPVHAQMDRDDEEIVRKDVHLNVGNGGASVDVQSVG